MGTRRVARQRILVCVIGGPSPGTPYACDRTVTHRHLDLGPIILDEWVRQTIGNGRRPSIRHYTEIITVVC